MMPRIVRLAVSTAVLTAMLSAPPVSAASIGRPMIFSQTHPPGSRYMGIRLLGALDLGKAPVDGLNASELSGLAWDEDEQLLYAVSDKGYLVHLRIGFVNGMLAGADLVAAYPLRDARGKRVGSGWWDAEDLAIRDGNDGRKGNTKLLVSFEQHARIMRYRPDGELLGKETLPAVLRDDHHYRSTNNELEAVTLLSGIGVLTAPEWPLQGTRRDMRCLYGLDGSQWCYPPLDPDYSSVSSLETTPDHRVLILERRYKNIFWPVIFAVRRAALDFTAHPRGADIEVEDIARFSSTDGFAVDNFEGLAHHQGNRYFMVSDDNNSSIQKTVLIYFEILD